jgi:hypothetical protein
MLRHPSFTCKSYDEYKDKMLEFQKLPPSIEKHNAIVEYKREVERTLKMKTLTSTVTKRQGSPDFVIGSFGFKAEDLVNYCNSKGYINFDILKGKESGQYVKVSDYGVEETKTEPQELMKFDDEEIPF